MTKNLLVLVCHVVQSLFYLYLSLCFLILCARCGFRIQGENENGKGKWSEESLVVVPGKPKTKNTGAATDNTQTKRKKKRKKKKNAQNSNATALAVQFRTELNDLLREPSTDLLKSLIKRLKNSEVQTAEIQMVLDDALTALEIKEEEIALRSQISHNSTGEGILFDHSSSEYSGPMLVDGISVQQAEKTLRQLNRVAAVRSKLQGALISNNIEELEQAIEMAEQWENSQLNYEIQACNDKIRQLSVHETLDRPAKQLKFTCAEKFSAFEVSDEDKQNV